MEAPREDAQLITEDRFPCPEILETFTGDGKERWLKCVLNPSNVTDVNSNETFESRNFLTDDASYKVFYDYLKKLVVST